METDSAAAAARRASTPPRNQAASKPKQRRVTQACDYCHQRSIRCRPSGDGVKCHNCRDFNQACTYHRKPRRRGVQPRAAAAAAAGSGPGAHPRASSQAPEPGLSDTDHTPPAATPRYAWPVAVAHRYRGADAAAEQHQLAEPWRAPAMASQATIVDLVDLYFEIAYPVFPFFHQPSFTRRISRANYTGSRTLFALTMAVCALVSSRIRDNAVTNPRWALDALRELSPEAFYNETRRQLVDVGGAGSGLDVLRAHAILAVTAIQNGRIRDMQQHTGTYHTLVAMDGLHDELNWPADVGVVETEERRRLFWSMYRLDIYVSVVWGGVVRPREQQCNVAYPLAVDDEFLHDCHGADRRSPNSLTPSSAPAECWLTGWNFITDLYRMLEHALAWLRSHSSRPRRRPSPNDVFDHHHSKPGLSDASVRSRVLQMYLDMPACFKETPELTYNAKNDRFGFQAANITGTLQMVRMVLLAAGGASIGQRCQILREVVDAFVAIPVNYLLAMSTPLLYHLGSIGAFLGAFSAEPLSEPGYGQMRSIMLSMAQLLENLGTLCRSADASDKLRSQVARIDEYMASQRRAPPLDMAHAAGETVVLAPPAPVEVRNLHANQYHQPMAPELPDGWSFQEVPAELLGDLSWNFDFPQ